MQAKYTGSCLCGGIKFAIDKFEALMGHCHCQMCRKFHGAAYATFGGVKPHNLHWREGESLLQSYLAENGTIRKFCRKCGSSLVFESARTGEDEIEIALGALDTDIQERPDAHIYLSYKADWDEPHDGLPRFLEGRDCEN